jgi:hypothetical protein
MKYQSMKAVAIKKGQTKEHQLSRKRARFGVTVAARSSSSFMSQLLRTTERQHDKRNG